MPGVAQYTDISRGCPGETEGEFGRTVDLIREARFDLIYSFVYSRRPGTPAAGMADDVLAEVKSDRLHRLQEIQAGIQAGINAGYVGRVEEVLVEGPSAMDPGVLASRTNTGKIVNFTGPSEWTGRLLEVRILNATANSMRGEARDAAASLTSLRHRDIYEESLSLKGGSAP